MPTISPAALMPCGDVASAPGTSMVVYENVGLARSRLRGALASRTGAPGAVGETSEQPAAARPRSAAITCPRRRVALGVSRWCVIFASVGQSGVRKRPTRSGRPRVWLLYSPRRNRSDGANFSAARVARRDRRPYARLRMPFADQAQRAEDGRSPGADANSSQPERWQRVKALFLDALEQPLSDRSAFVARVTSGDPDLRRELESLLGSDEAAASFVEVPAAALLASNGRESAG